MLAGSWSPEVDRIIFGVGGFAAFFGGLQNRFPKPADRVEDGAQVAMVNADGTRFLETKGITALTREYDNFPLWSPRGDLIMLARLVDGAYEIHTIKPDGTGLRRLIFTNGNDAHMTWSTDGELTDNQWEDGTPAWQPLPARQVARH